MERTSSTIRTSVERDQGSPEISLNLNGGGRVSAVARTGSWFPGQPSRRGPGRLPTAPILELALSWGD